MATAAERRKQQNRGVKAGTVRIGAKGKTVRRYNPKTGRWDVTKKNMKPGVPLAKPGSRSKTTSVPSSLQSTKTSKTTARATPSTRYEGPKRSVKPKSSWESFANNPVGYVTRGSSNRVVTNKTSDFPKGSKLQLRKTNRKDANGRDVYRWTKVVTPNK